MTKYSKSKTCTYCTTQKFSNVYCARDYITGREFTVKKCKKCFLVQTFPKLNVKDLRKFYSGYRENTGKRFFQVIEDILNSWHARRIKRISKYAKKGNILDIGCGRGTELEILKKEGWEPFGTEFNTDLKENLLKKRINVFIGNFWQAKYKKDFFEVVTLWHSLEHLTDIGRAFKEIRKITKKNGVLVIAVPNFDSYEQKFFTDNWFHLDVPRHLVHFSEKTLSNIIEESGFQIFAKKYFSPEYDFYSFCQSSLNKIFKNHNLLYKVLNKDVLIRKTDPNLLIQLPALFLLAAISIFIVPLMGISKEGGTIEIIARKK